MNKYKKFLKNCKNIEKYYEYLIELTSNNSFVGATNEWIIDNYYVIAEIKVNITKMFKENKHLNKIVNSSEHLYNYLNNVCYDNNFSINFELIKEQLDIYQQDEKNYIKYETIDAIPIMIFFMIVERLANLCVNKKSAQEEKQKVRDLVKHFESKIKNDEVIKLDEYISFDSNIKEHPEIIEQLNDSLKSLGELSGDLFVQLDEMLNEYNLELKDMINLEHQDSINNNILISNIFGSFRNILKIKNEDLIDKISKTEAILKKDAHYKYMTFETKGLYRSIITKRTKKTSEYDYACKLLDRSLKSGKHIGFYLLKGVRFNLRSKIYIFCLIILTVLISGGLSFITLDYWWLSFILLLVPISELVMQFLNKILLKIHPCKPLPKMNFSKGIDKNNATMVVIPTIVKDTKKVDKMFELLEKYYLANKSDNLYFTLLGDCCESNIIETDFDSEIAKYGDIVSKKLNQKYEQKIFSFVYRRRAFNESEGKYLGYERKRGALLHFNKLLLGNLSSEDKEKYVYFENVTESLNPIKYVITIDTDTELVLNSALSLVGVMAHPLNKPVLNKEKTKVISGYGIVQPRVNIDIESTNKSIYSQLMAGIGGFDVYSTIIPNFYQDVFNEGSFVGKGIYDLQVFDEVLSNAFPDNLILSHDLLEGNYLRCGFASDIELIDDFPSEFLVEASRQHRWTRGDVQIIGWLRNKVKNKEGKKVRNPLNTIEKFKIFDNIRRIWFNPSMLFLMIFSFVFGNPLVTLLVILFIISLPMIFYIKDLMHRQNKKMFTFKYYNNLLFGFLSIVYRIFVSFIIIPYYSYLYLNSFFKALYRMFISHKNLLNWVTAEDAAKNIKKGLLNYVLQFKTNYIISILLIVLSILFKQKYLAIAIIIAIIFSIAPLILCSFSKRKDIKLIGLTDHQNDKLLDVAYRTWLYFDSFLTEENNYLIPDNLQLNREEKLDTKTSPTDIGMSITSVISASELGFITDDKALELIGNIINTIEKLEKWNGHLYNWYNIKKLKKIVPFVVSSVDSGNLAASLVVAKEYVLKKNYNELYNRINKIFNEMDFSKLYTNQEVFSIAYDTSNEELSGYNYNKFASESRILSFVAIMKGDIPSKHWLCLDKTLTKYKKHKGVVSWSGTSFEYFMPLIFMRTYPNTLLDESYFFARFCQKNYINEINNKLPWGISESAYDELDDGLNYKYRAFATPYLKVIDEKDNRLVLAPYATILAITNDPVDVYHNLKKFKKLKMYGDYGYYESYDYTTGNRVLAYYAHHQGMILSSLANHLKDNVIQNYFHSDLRTQAFEILLKEKVQFNPVIDMKVVGYKKYNYEREKVENDIREYNYVSDIPQLSVLSNSKYTLLINDRGNGFSRYNTIQLNRYRKITKQDYGTYIYIKDLATDNVWSNTFAPTNVKPEKYNVVFANDRIKYSRTDNQITTQTEIVVVKDNDAEVRKLTFKNNSEDAKRLELTTYTEVILEENIDDIIHRAFKNLFISSKYDKENDALIMRRRNNSKKMSHYMVGKLLVEDNNSLTSYETERDRFIGRGHNTYNAISLKQALSNKSGTNIDPVLSLRKQIEVKPKQEVTVYYIQGFSKSLEGIQKILSDYSNFKGIETSFEYTTLASNMNTKLLGIKGENIRVFNIMLNYLYQTSRHFIVDERKNLLALNSLSQSGLWKYGISGDRPIILVDIHSSVESRLAIDTIRAFEYFKSKGIFVDLIIINSETDEYKEVIKREVEQEIYRMNKLFNFFNTPGSIHLLDANKLSKEELILLNMVARLSFNSSRDSSLYDAVNKMHLNNKIVDFPKTIYIENKNNTVNTTNIKFFNGYGGFVKDGREYKIINQNTPVGWSNVIANENFGTVITNDGCGFTYSHNSQMFKLTSWTNDVVVTDKSEGISINGKNLKNNICRHGFGYSVFESFDDEYELETTHFVAKEDKIKFYKNKLTNTTDFKKKYKVTFWINPTLGPNEEKSSRYLLTDFHKALNSVIIRNVYHNEFSGVSVFMGSTLPVTSYSIDRIIDKSITVEVEVEPKCTYEFSFMLGTATGLEELKTITDKYNNQKVINEEYKIVIDYWNNIINTVKIKTPDNSFNYMMNGWYLYQTISSRLYARAGFYQVGGAYGFRDQLQDAMNICEILPEITRNQIIKNAMHQFKEGDVLHWWHDDNHFGLRSRYMDDYIWLLYATCRYIEVTGDVKILEEEVPFVEGQVLLPNEEERGMNFSCSNDKKSLLDHLLLCIHRMMHTIGSNGLPLMYGGDWNDGMNKVGILGKGTSVWLGFFECFVLKQFIDICYKYKIEIDDKKYVSFIEELSNNLNNVAWDGEYYARAFFDDGTPLGVKESKECKIDLISQSFSILSCVAPFDKIGTIIKSVEDNLVDKNLKIIKLLDPPFKETKNIPGYIMDYPKGIRENGGQYTHSVAWYVMALIKCGYIERAYQYYQMINPINRALTQEDSNKYKIEPYVIAADIYSNFEYPGRGGWTWYTGSAGWFYNVGLNNILGFKKQGNLLTINPSVPSEWQSFELEYKYLDTLYKIKVNLKTDKNNIMVDGESINTKSIKLKNDKRIHAVIVNMRGGN